MTTSPIDTPAQQDLIDAIAEVAAAWRDPEHPARMSAVERTLEAPNRFTEQALAFAINQQMDGLSPEALGAWVMGRWTDAPHTVGVLNAGNVPFVGLQDLLAVLLVGHAYVGSTSSKSPYLLPTFVEEVKAHCASLPARFVDVERLFRAADAVLATGSDDTTRWVREQCAAHGIDESHQLLRGHRYSVAVIDGNESDDEREDLALDALLHEGYGCRNVAIIWAPRDLNPDPYLNAFALVRGVFPSHPEMPGTLQMRRAFLEATGQSHAYGEGLEFLVSRGAPEPQQPGHIRWTEYDAVDEVNGWLENRADAIQLVAARPAIARQLTDAVPAVAPGETQRPPLDWTPDGTDTVAFLETLT